MDWATSRELVGCEVGLLLPLLHFLCNKGLDSLSQYPFLGNFARSWIYLDLQRGRQMVGELSEIMIKERRSTLN